jgi:hypothetical protein
VRFDDGPTYRVARAGVVVLVVAHLLGRENPVERTDR